MDEVLPLALVRARRQGPTTRSGGRGACPPQAGLSVDVRFITSSPNLAGRPEPVLPEFAFIGRSNCGKSSLINHFLGRKGLARTSGNPGKTRLLNYYLVDERYYVVDLPGYGYRQGRQGPAGRLARACSRPFWPPRTVRWRFSSCWTCATSPAPRTARWPAGSAPRGIPGPWR